MAAVAGLGGALAGTALLLRDEPPPADEPPEEEPSPLGNTPLPELEFGQAAKPSLLPPAGGVGGGLVAPPPPANIPSPSPSRKRQGDGPEPLPEPPVAEVAEAEAVPPVAMPEIAAIPPEPAPPTPDIPPPANDAGADFADSAQAPPSPEQPQPDPVAEPIPATPEQATPTKPTVPAAANPPPAPTGARRVIPRRAPAPEVAEPAEAARPVLPEPAFGAIPAHSDTRPSTPLAPAPSRLALPKPAFGGPAATQPATPAPPPAALGAPGTAAGVGAAPLLTYDDELILQIETRRGDVSDTITAYGTRAGVYLPLGEIARMLDVAVTVSDEGQYAAGWVLDEKSTLAINLRAGTLRQGGREARLDPRDAVAVDGELYLRAERFADLMPLTLKVDLRAQTVILTTLRPFPFEQRGEREAMRQRLGGRAASAGAPRYPREETPWQALGFPLADVELRAASDSTRGTRAEADLRMAGDIAFMTGQVFASGSSRDGLTAARIQLGRRDPDARLLGPLGATEFALGDVTTASLPLGLRGIGGRGGMISNTALETASVFDRIDLRGELPDGYEAELYRNNTLIGSTRSAVDGRYEFLQVPVEFGLNVFRLVLYGPQGQRREDVRRISVGDGRLGQGELRYAFGVAQKDVNLLGLHGPDFAPGQDHGAWRATGQLQYGLGSALTTTLGGAWYESRGKRHWLATAGLRTGIGAMAAQFDFGLNQARGKAAEARLGGTLAGVNWTATHAEYFGPFSDELRAFTTDPLRRASEAEVNATLHLGTASGDRAIPLAARARRIAFADGRAQTDASLRASTLVSRLLVSNSLTLTQASARGGGGSNTRLTGSFDLASLSGSRTQYRAALGYEAVPQARLTTAAVEVDRALGADTRVKLSAGRLFKGGDTVLGLSAIHRLGPFSLAFDGNVNFPDHNYSAVLRLGFSFGRNPLTRAAFVAQPGMAAGGAVAVRAFEDANGNRRFDPGEPALENVEFDTGSLTARTAPNGAALIGQLGDANRTHLRLNAETLPDIALAPQRGGVEIIPRPGRIHVSEFAVDALADIAGTARFGDSRQAVTGLVLQLLDAQGKVAGRARTGAGGMFLFEQLHPGEYRVAIEPGQAARLGLRLNAAPVVKLGGSARSEKLELVVVKGV